MAKRFECPRCGAGVKPGDSQCFRCGESMKENVVPNPGPAHEPTASPGFEIRKDEHIPSAKEMARSISKQSTSTTSAPSSKKGFEEKGSGRNEKELSEREKAINASALQLEKDTRSLEFAIKNFEKEDAEVHQREQALKEREKQLDSLARRMEEELERLKALEGEQGVSATETKHLRELSDDYSKRAIEERRRQRQQLDQEIEEKVERLKVLEGFISLAKSTPESEYDADKEDVLRKMQEKNQLNDSVVQALIRSIDDEIHDQMLTPSKRNFEIISTYNERLNSILGGGIPAGHVVLINGAPGTMKSTLAFHFLHSAASRSNKKVMYFSLEQKRGSLIKQMERMGMPMSETKDNMMVIDMVDLRRTMAKEKGDWRTIILRYIKNVHAEMPFDIFVLDSLDSFKSIAQFEFNRQSMKDLFDWFKELKITVLFVTERPLEALDISPQGETYLADGVIELLMPEIGDAKVYRWLRCVKMRGMQNDPRYYAFYHADGVFKFSLPLADTRN